MIQILNKNFELLLKFDVMDVFYSGFFNGLYIFVGNDDVTGDF